MKENNNIIFQFMTDILGLDEYEAMENSLKLENSLSEDVLIRFKYFIKFTNTKLLRNNEYSKLLKNFLKE